MQGDENGARKGKNKERATRLTQTNEEGRKGTEKAGAGSVWPSGREGANGELAHPADRAEKGKNKTEKRQNEHEQ